jgi:hypothetical protein
LNLITISIIADLRRYYKKRRDKLKGNITHLAKVFSKLLNYLGNCLFEGGGGGRRKT